jgi:hypothetical protein
MRHKPKTEELSNVSLLIYLLVHFPQIFTINYNLVEAKIKLSFMLKINIGHDAYIKFKRRFYECVRAYSELSTLDSIPRLNRKVTKSWTLLQVTFNRKSITVEEVNLVSNLILNQFKNLLSRKKEHEENLLAFREAGKVYVFDK